MSNFYKVNKYRLITGFFKKIKKNKFFIKGILYWYDIYKIWSQF